MSNTFTYNWQKQPNISCKGKSTNSVVPQWSRPFNNNDIDIGNIGTAFKARPIKQWRKQLFPRNNCGTTGIGMPMDLPGGSSYIGDDTNINNSGIIKENIINNNENCCSKTKIIRRANSNLEKQYYTDSRAYLKSRCKTFDQNQSGIINNNPKNYNSNGELLWPNNENDGPQTRYILSCTNNNCPSTKATTIYKPNNRNYGTQGAVSSSDRLLRLKLNTINKNGQSFLTAYGSQGANAGRYHGTSASPYFQKNKENKCKKSNYRASC